ncbi:MAG: hypothetical protein KAJ15_05235 [Spirochaetes bacterium]|nr:hypothetical protein [Spirochaetota bacterium]
MNESRVWEETQNCMELPFSGCGKVISGRSAIQKGFHRPGPSLTMNPPPTTPGNNLGLAAGPVYLGYNPL